jgi:hypothetical protein
VHVVASEEARKFVAERGGRLFVRPRVSGCCHPVRWLEASTEADPRITFRRVARDGMEVWAPVGLRRLPDELEVGVRRFPRRHLEAYWDGCAWIV